ncbi:hypothetical protein ACP4OV_006280 [Aristida adscensionis]
MAGPGSKAEAAPAKAAEKSKTATKKTKLVTVPTPQETAERLMNYPIKNRNRPFPVLSEELLAVFEDPRSGRR